MAVKEIRGQFSDITVISELRGAYPNVPIAADVDYAALIAGDDSPIFLTIPIGKANVTSGNKRHYDEAWLQELEKQTLATKPIGLMGHLSEAQRATEFPMEAIHWVGAVREQDTLWGKGYIPPGPIRDRIRRYKAQGKSIATSIDATADGVWSDSLGAYHMQANTLKLAQIDIAPADRAGIPALANVPVLTSEMAPANQKEEPKMAEKSKLEYINEMTAEDARLLPDPVRAAVLATVATPVEVATVATIREALGLDPKADVVSAITEMRRVQAEQAKAAVTSRITELVTAGIKIEDVRPLVTELITARNPQTVQAAEDAYKAVVALDSVAKVLATHVQETMGPPQRRPVQSQTGKATYFNIPKKEVQ
jgi:hypothetical protein